LKLLLDEDSEARMLVQRLVAAGHDVATVGGLGQRGTSDAAILSLARQQGRVLLTRNCSDFKRLHDSDGSHPGILAIYQERDPSKDMTYKTIVQAIEVLAKSGTPLPGAFICLNAWRGGARK
jgi:predicted nuclease of predicted toxin-antitoxin system